MKILEKIINNWLFIFIGLLAIFGLSVAKFCNDHQVKAGVECVKRGGVWVDTGRSTYLCMNKDALK